MIRKLHARVACLAVSIGLVGISPAEVVAECCDNQGAINLHLTGCDLAWATCRFGCAFPCILPNSAFCTNCKNSCNNNRSNCRNNVPSCTPCRQIGEKCSLFNKCDDGLKCHLVKPFQALCGPPKRGNLLDQVICAGLYTPVQCEIAKGLDQTVTLGTEAGAECFVVAVAVEVGVAYSRDGVYGCYKTTCSTGFAANCGAGVGVNFGTYDIDFSRIAGPSTSSCAAVGTPFNIFSVGICQDFVDEDECTT